jgi:hypothetical protein
MKAWIAWTTSFAAGVPVALIAAWLVINARMGFPDWSGGGGASWSYAPYVPFVQARVDSFHSFGRGGRVGRSAGPFSSCLNSAEE